MSNAGASIVSNTSSNPTYAEHFSPKYSKNVQKKVEKLIQEEAIHSPPPRNIISKSKPPQSDEKASPSPKMSLSSKFNNAYVNSSPIKLEEVIEEGIELVKEKHHKSPLQVTEEIEEESADVDGLLNWAQNLPDEFGASNSSAFFPKNH